MIEKIYNISIKNYDEENKEPQVLCLGFFDCVHQGHLKLINRAKQIAFMNNYLTAIFTFENNPLKLFKDEQVILTFKERCFVFEELQMDFVYKATFDNKFASIDKDTFLDILIGNKNIKAIVVGSDYTYGKDREGNVKHLKEYCDAHDIKLYVESLLMLNDEKLSSSYLREKVKEGNLDELNSFLVSPYTIMGVVQKGRGVGEKELFPTANISIDPDKIPLAPGVYYTHVFIDGLRYRAATNVGFKPTYGIDTYNIESYILFYTKKLYGKEIVIEFEEKMRDIVKFNSPNELKVQIQKDIDYIMGQNGGY
ncbi:MAG: riboflavin biosynthesis protein RibF [Clostridia bacterium]|nr:riboflavin biosynthesis protein RibF [Clostridia bacterium]